MDYKRRDGMEKLNLDSDAGKFRIWSMHAGAFLANGNPGVRELLKWAGEETLTITRELEIAKSLEVGQSYMGYDVCAISYTIYDGLLNLVEGNLLHRITLETPCGQGFEMWRRIFKEWRNKSPQVMETYRTGYTAPVRCKNVEEV